MAAAEKAELVFIPFPATGHLPSMVEMGRKLIAQRPDQISITILLMRFIFPNTSITESLIQSICHDNSSNDIQGNKLKFIMLPQVPGSSSLRLCMDAYKPVVRQTLSGLPKRPAAGIILDQCCADMIDVANEIGVSSYIYCAPGSAFIHLWLHFGLGVAGAGGVTTSHPVVPEQFDDGGTTTACPDPVVELVGFKNPIPSKVWPDIFRRKEHGWHEQILKDASRIPETKAIIINTFVELESDLIRSFSALGKHINNMPMVYPVGPMINSIPSSLTNSHQKDQIMSWLDAQPSCSVVFLCFGSFGTFDAEQVTEIAIALEHSGQRFLWSLRWNRVHTTCGSAQNEKAEGSNLKSAASAAAAAAKSLQQDEEEYPDHFNQILPQGFQDRTSNVGRVIGWAPQALVLGHRAVGAFVSHCGWNSTLESLYFGVPLVAWPMYAEQQLNAFALVKEFELAVEIKMDYTCGAFQGNKSATVGAAVIEKALRMVMEEEEGKKLREKTKHISEMARKSLQVGGSSYNSLGHFIDHVFGNLC